MEITNIEIFAHDNDLDVAHKINTMELYNWISHLLYVRKELDNFILFYNAQSSQELIKQERLTQRFGMIQADNDVILSQLERFKNSRNRIPECQDIHCDMTFIQEHEKCRRMFLYHIDKYRKLKDVFFGELKEKFIKVQNLHNSKPFKRTSL